MKAKLKQHFNYRQLHRRDIITIWDFTRGCQIYIIKIYANLRKESEIIENFNGSRGQCTEHENTPEVIDIDRRELEEEKKW